jgi:hypothetical protein
MGEIMYLGDQDPLFKGRKSPKTATDSAALEKTFHFPVRHLLLPPRKKQGLPAYGNKAIGGNRVIHPLK